MTRAEHLANVAYHWSMLAPTPEGELRLAELVVAELNAAEPDTIMEACALVQRWLGNDQPWDLP